ncbi:MAG: hypothetical protein DRI57_31130 [Deltaproteobacteria bacterium]|nr:MAG: hypothetical protein DRI57_31130 [Deltaproteobacteria bacterium]
MSEYTRVVILCEDRQQEVFARHFLINCGIRKQRIYAKVAPKGLGSGEQYVREEYPEEVGSYRRFCNHKNISLVVLIDADMNTVTDRLKKLEDELVNASLAKRQPDEKIAIFVPKRNIETWISYLQDQTQTIDEEKEYPKYKKESACKPFAEKLSANRNQALPENAPSSLKAACDELPRIL